MSLFPFQNEPFLNFRDSQEMERMADAVRRVSDRLGESYPLRIGGRRVSTQDTFASRNPSDASVTVGSVALATPAHIDGAMQAAQTAFQVWSRVSPWERAAVLLRAGDILRQRRREMLAWLAFEVGKNFDQGDGEVAEAIDHFEYNARALLAASKGKEIQPLFPEINEYRYRPLGVGVVLSPFNFPTTLPVGMILGAVAAGNAVLFKPSAEASVIANQIVDVLEEAGLPPGVVNLLTGRGQAMGDALVGHPQVRFVAFVGSREVGCQIHKAASGLAPGQVALKRVMTEMGGKNATVVAPSADMDWTAREVVLSALGYQGQKCSATSRVILVDEIHDAFVERMMAEVERTAREMGAPTDNKAYGPVITGGAREKVLSYLEMARGEGKVLLKGAPVSGPGYFITPTVIDGVLPQSPLAQDEIFGPLISVLRAKSFEDAISIANSVEYALTGAAFSTDPAELDYARDNFYVGNLYLNRSSTGAMAGVHPFGGYKLSGTGPKVGGPDYLSFFMEAQTITQKVRYPRENP